MKNLYLSARNLRRIRANAILSLIVVSGSLATPRPGAAQTFGGYPAGDDDTTSLGEFQIVLDTSWVKIFNALLANSPWAGSGTSGHLRIYHNGTFTSPALYDPATKIGRSDAFYPNSAIDYAGALAGSAPGRTYVQQSQLVLHPSWPGPPVGARVVHTFLKSMRLADTFTGNYGFTVKAGMQAPTRPVCAGQVEGGSATADFPANSFFNVYVVVNIPASALMPALELVNVDPLLVQHTNIAFFPPHLVYYHENITAVPIYFNQPVTIHNPLTGADIQVHRGDLFGQLTLAGHGVSFSSVETETFQLEFENESATNSAPLTVNPTTNITILDYSPDYNAAPRSLAGGVFQSGGAFIFNVNHVVPNTTNYLQYTTNVAGGPWQTISMFIPATNTYTFTDPDAQNGQQRFYRLSLTP
jgi:hypothetical protein